MPLEVKIHLIFALICLVLGAYMLVGKKGNRAHKILGWAWVLCMMISATSAIFIHEIRIWGPFSPIHIFVPVTFFGLYRGIAHARGKNVAGHRAAMRALYWCALCIPFAFALAPNRLLANIFHTTELEWIPVGIMAGVILGVGIYYKWENFWKRFMGSISQRVGWQKS